MGSRLNRSAFFSFCVPAGILHLASWINYGTLVADSKSNMCPSKYFKENRRSSTSSVDIFIFVIE